MENEKKIVNNKQASLTEQEMEGLKEMKSMNQEYLGSGDGSKPVREYLTKAGEDDVLLVRFLRGRKLRPKHAWESVKRYAEVRYDQYPEIFVAGVPKIAVEMFKNGTMGILKNRDSKGRLIGFLDANRWDPDKVSLEILLIMAVHLVEYLLLNEDFITNGVIFIQECSKMGMKHAKQYTLTEMLRFINVFWFAYPIKLKGVCYVNVPYVLTFLYGIIKPFMPKKLKERFLLTHSGKKFDPLHERISPDILPKCLGGKLEDDEAIDKALFASLLC